MRLLCAEGVSVRYGARHVLEGVDLVVSAGEVVGLIGPNGAGKTTLLRVLARLIRPEAGSLTFDGEPYERYARRALARAVAYLPQGALAHWPLTVGRLVALGRLPRLGPWRRPGEADIRAIGRAMEEADVVELADRPVTTLSDGERARTMLARALAVEPRVLLADEPITALDPNHQLQVMELLRALARRGGAVVVVLHDLTLAARFCDRVALLHWGRLLDEGTPEAVLTPENLLAAYGVRAVHGRRGDEIYVVPWERLEAGGGGPRPGEGR